MGRYYNGDIDGKFWFAVQSSDAADRFGVTGTAPNYIEYYFDKEDDLEEVEAELKQIKENIGEELFEKLDKFFEKNNGYNEDILTKAIGFEDEIMKNHELDISQILSEYADHDLGTEIRNCLVENGSCSFEAEC